MSTSPKSRPRGLQRLLSIKYYNVLKQESRFKIHFRARHCQNYRLYKKTLQIKVVKNEISYKKLSGCISLSPPGVELGAPKIAWF